MQAALRQSLGAAHGPPKLDLAQVEPKQALVVQSSLVVHGPPAPTREHVPPVQEPEQQSPSLVQLDEGGRQHCHKPVGQVPVQQSLCWLQAAPSTPQAQTPCWQLPEQQLALVEQRAPNWLQGAHTPEAQTPLQHWLPAWQFWPVWVQAQ